MCARRLTIWSRRRKRTRKRSSSWSTTVSMNSVSLSISISACHSVFLWLYIYILLFFFFPCPFFPWCPRCFGHTSLPPSVWTNLPVPSGLSSLQISAIAEELARKTEDAARQQEEITHLLSQIVDLQKKAKSVCAHGRTHEPTLTQRWLLVTLCVFCWFTLVCLFAVRGGERGALSTPGGS